MPPDEPEDNIRYLSNNGPSSKDGLPRPVTYDDQEAGLFIFQLTGGNGGADRLGGRTTPVCYIKGHTRESVLVEFLDKNPDLIEAKTLQGLIQAIGGQGREWRETAKEVAPRYYDTDEEYPTEYPNDHYTGEPKRCEFCNELVAKSNFPMHLATNCTGS